MKISTRKNFACSLLVGALVSCAAVPSETNNVQPVAAAEAQRSTRSTSDFWADADHVVRGTVVDNSGAPLAAKVALVSTNGSCSTTVPNGQFELGTSGAFPRTLCAWTKDGRIGWRVLESPPTDGPVRIKVTEEGAFLTLVPGDRSDRVSILSGDVPLHDVKFPAGESRTFVVPASAINFGTKGKPGQPADRRSVQLDAGSRTTVSF